MDAIARHGAVVADEDHRPFVPLDRVLERFDGFDVEVIGRLVQHEQIRVGQHEHRQRHPSPLTPRERRCPTLHLVSRKAEPSKVSLNQPALPLRTEFCDRVVNRRVQWDAAQLWL